MNLSNPFKRKPKQLDGDDTVDVEDFGTNDEVRKKQMMLMGGVGAVALVLGSMYIFDDGEDDPAKVDENGQEIQIATDDMVNRNMSQREWQAASEANPSAPSICKNWKHYDAVEREEPRHERHRHRRKPDRMSINDSICRRQKPR